MILHYSKDNFAQSAETKIKMEIYKQPIVRLVKVLKDKIKETESKLFEESDIDTTEKRIGDSHVKYLKNSYSNGYHEAEITFIGLSGLRVNCWKDKVNTQYLQKFTHIAIQCGASNACDHPRQEFLKQKRPREIAKAMTEWVDKIPHPRILV